MRRRKVADIALIPGLVVPFLTDSCRWGKVNNECQRLVGGGSGVGAIYLRLNGCLNLSLVDSSIILYSKRISIVKGPHRLINFGF